MTHVTLSPCDITWLADRRRTAAPLSTDWLQAWTLAAQTVNSSTARPGSPNVAGPSRVIGMDVVQGDQTFK